MTGNMTSDTTGKWIFICGPSGVGKHSVIAWSIQALAGQSSIVFAPRLVTRTAQPGSSDEAVGEHDFLSLRQSGGLCWHWQAHGFHYGISQHYASVVSAGGTVVINGSRSHVDGLAVSPSIKRVEITASSEKIAARLAQRGRDAPEAILQRLKRNVELGQPDAPKADITIHNDADLAAAGTQLKTYLAVQAGADVRLARSITAA